MIYTVTLNPAIDKTVEIGNFAIDRVNRVEQYREDPGGKGINVSKMVNTLHGDTVALLITGGYTGQQLKEQLDEEGVTYRTFEVEGATRINTKIVDKVNETFTDVNERGPFVGKDTIADMDAYLTETLTEDDILVLAGSLPQGVPKDIYNHWIRLASAKGTKVILDADGDVFEMGLEAKPYMIKPNDKELEMFFDTTFESEESMIEKALEILEKGIRLVVISQGEKGCLLLAKEGVIKIPPLNVNVQSTVGAGDSMVAAIAHELQSIDESQPADGRLQGFAQALKMGVAASTATIQEVGTKMGSLENIQSILQQVQIEFKMKFYKE